MNILANIIIPDVEDNMEEFVAELAAKEAKSKRPADDMSDDDDDDRRSHKKARRERSRSSSTENCDDDSEDVDGDEDDEDDDDDDEEENVVEYRLVDPAEALADGEKKKKKPYKKKKKSTEQKMAALQFDVDDTFRVVFVPMAPISRNENRLIGVCSADVCVVSDELLFEAVKRQCPEMTVEQKIRMDQYVFRSSHVQHACQLSPAEWLAKNAAAAAGGGDDDDDNNWRQLLARAREQVRLDLFGSRESRTQLRVLRRALICSLDAPASQLAHVSSPAMFYPLVCTLVEDRVGAEQLTRSLRCPTEERKSDVVRANCVVLCDTENERLCFNTTQAAVASVVDCTAGLPIEANVALRLSLIGEGRLASKMAPHWAAFPAGTKLSNFLTKKYSPLATGHNPVDKEHESVSKLMRIVVYRSGFMRFYERPFDQYRPRARLLSDPPVECQRLVAEDGELQSAADVRALMLRGANSPTEVQMRFNSLLRKINGEKKPRNLYGVALRRYLKFDSPSQLSAEVDAAALNLLLPILATRLYWRARQIIGPLCAAYMFCNARLSTVFEHLKVDTVPHNVFVSRFFADMRLFDDAALVRRFAASMATAAVPAERFAEVLRRAQLAVCQVMRRNGKITHEHVGATDVPHHVDRCVPMAGISVDEAKLFWPSNRASYCAMLPFCVRRKSGAEAIVTVATLAEFALQESFIVSVLRHTFDNCNLDLVRSDNEKDLLVEIVDILNKRQGNTLIAVSSKKEYSVWLSVAARLANVRVLLAGVDTQQPLPAFAEPGRATLIVPRADRFSIEQLATTLLYLSVRAVSDNPSLYMTSDGSAVDTMMNRLALEPLAPDLVAQLRSGVCGGRIVLCGLAFVCNGPKPHYSGGNIVDALYFSDAAPMRVAESYTQLVPFLRGEPTTLFTPFVESSGGQCAELLVNTKLTFSTFEHNKLHQFFDDVTAVERVNQMRRMLLFADSASCTVDRLARVLAERTKNRIQSAEGFDGGAHWDTSALPVVFDCVPENPGVALKDGFLNRSGLETEEELARAGPGSFDYDLSDETLAADGVSLSNAELERRYERVRVRSWAGLTPRAGISMMQSMSEQYAVVGSVESSVESRLAAVQMPPWFAAAPLPSANNIDRPWYQNFEMTDKMVLTWLAAGAFGTKSQQQEQQE